MHGLYWRITEFKAKAGVLKLITGKQNSAVLLLYTFHDKEN